MLQSMTGYGRGECMLYNRKFLVEIKSVNHRYCDITVKLPRVLNTFEENVRKKVSGKLQRGKADIYISFETLSSDDIRMRLNTALSDAYVEQLRIARDRYDLQDISLEVISRFPDIITVDKNTEDEKILGEMWESLNQALDNALEQFVAMRSREGLSLKNDIKEKSLLLQGYLRQVSERAPIVAGEYAAKLRARLAEALGDVAIDQSRLVMEITLMADKACIDEEITRLKSHISQLADIVESHDPVGRKLDFLVQEMNREINTIGSKSNDLEITKLVVEMKSELEKIREQVQNIE